MAKTVVISVQYIYIIWWVRRRYCTRVRPYFHGPQASENTAHPQNLKRIWYIVVPRGHVITLPARIWWRPTYHSPELRNTNLLNFDHKVKSDQLKHRKLYWQLTPSYCTLAYCIRSEGYSTWSQVCVCVCVCVTQHLTLHFVFICATNGTNFLGGGWRSKIKAIFPENASLWSYSVSCWWLHNNN